MTVTIVMFGRVTHTLHAAAMRLRSLFTSFTFCNITNSCSLRLKENIRCSIPLCFTDIISAMINLHYYVDSQDVEMEKNLEDPELATEVKARSKFWSERKFFNAGDENVETN